MNLKIIPGYFVTYWYLNRVIVSAISIYPLQVFFAGAQNFEPLRYAFSVLRGEFYLFNCMPEKSAE